MRCCEACLVWPAHGGLETGLAIVSLRKTWVLLAVKHNNLRFA